MSDAIEPGLDILTMSNESISGWLPFERTGFEAGCRRALPYVSTPERDALHHLAFHPGVAYVQRGDVRQSFARAHRLEMRLAQPYIIEYDFGGTIHRYYPDWVGVLTNGAPFAVEASITRFKSDDQSHAKLAAADAHFTARGGWFGLYLPDDAVSDRRMANLQGLHAHLRAFSGYEDVLPDLEPLLFEVEPLRGRDIVARLTPAHGERLAAAAMWHRIALAAAEGRLLVDLDAHLVDLDTPLSLVPPASPPIAVPVLPVSLAGRDLSRFPDVDPPASFLPGRTVDVATVPASHRAAFLRNLGVVRAVLGGEDPAAVALRLNISAKQVGRIVGTALSGGEEALRPYHRREVVTEMDPVFIDPIRRLLKRRQRLTYRQITEAPELVEARDKALAAGGQAPSLPSYKQVRHLCKRLEKGEQDVKLARSGERHAPHSATSVVGYVRRIAGPVRVLQVDEHWLDLFVVTDEGTGLTERVHAAVLICARTAAILGAVLSPRALVEEDYLRLVKQAMEPKDDLVRRFGCTNPWPCHGRPVQILSDRGRIFVSAHATEVVVDRFGIDQAKAPPYAPSVKGVVEALFRWITERFSHRLEGTTKSSPADRGTYDSQEAARRRGVTFRELESLFYRAIVDGYMQDWDALRAEGTVGRRIDIWQREVERAGVPQWIGSRDALKLLLMRSHNRKSTDGRYLVHGPGISFMGLDYVGEEGLTRRLRDEWVSFLWDRRDIGTIYLLDAKGAVIGPAHAAAYAGRRISLWELEAERKEQRKLERLVRAGASANLTAIVADADAQGRRRQQRTAAKAASRAAALDDQQPDIHTADALAERRRLAEKALAGPAWRTDPARLPGPADDDGPSNVVPFVRRIERRAR